MVERDEPPCVILYDDKQIADVKRFCASPNCLRHRPHFQSGEMHCCRNYIQVHRRHLPSYQWSSSLPWPVLSPLGCKKPIYIRNVCACFFQCFTDLKHFWCSTGIIHWFCLMLYIFLMRWMCTLQTFWCLFSFSVLLLIYIKNVCRRKPRLRFHSVAFG